MKRCPGCGTINQDYEYTCGVCKHSLSSIVSENLEELVSEHVPIPSLRPKLKLSRLLLLLSGPGLILAGILVLALDAPLLYLGLALLIPGLFAILVLMSSQFLYFRGRKRMEGGGGSKSGAAMTLLDQDPLTEQQQLSYQRERDKAAIEEPREEQED